MIQEPLQRRRAQGEPLGVKLQHEQLTPRMTLVERGDPMLRDGLGVAQAQTFHQYLVVGEAHRQLQQITDPKWQRRCCLRRRGTVEGQQRIQSLTLLG